MKTLINLFFEYLNFVAKVTFFGVCFIILFWTFSIVYSWFDYLQILKF